jgi:hypothetical protein
VWRSWHKPCSIEPDGNLMNQGRYGRAACFNHKARAVAVQRIAQGVEVAQTTQRISDLQERAVLIMAQATENVVRRGMQINRAAALLQVFAIGCPEYGATPGGQDTQFFPGEFINDALFKVAKRVFAFPLKKLTDGHANSALDDLVRIEKRPAQTTRELTPYSGFSGAGETDEGNAGK